MIVPAHAVGRELGIDVVGDLAGSHTVGDSIDERPTALIVEPMDEGADLRVALGTIDQGQIEVDDLGAAVERLTAAGVTFRSEITTGMGGRQVVADDPAGNPVELFEPAER